MENDNTYPKVGSLIETKDILSVIYNKKTVILPAGIMGLLVEHTTSAYDGIHTMLFLTENGKLCKFFFKDIPAGPKPVYFYLKFNLVKNAV